MFAIVVILLVAYILVPLVDLTLNEAVRVPVKVVVYILALIGVVYLLIAGKSLL